MKRMTRMTVQGFNHRALHELRTELGMTQEDLALMIDVAGSSISSWEAGRTSPDPRNLLRLAEVLEVSTDELLHPADPRWGLAHRRMRMGLSQLDASAATGMTIGVLRSIERAVRLPTNAEASSLAEAYGVSAKEILGTARAFREHRREQVAQLQAAHEKRKRRS